LEDDVHLATDLGEWTRDLRWWPQDADIVKLERWRARTLKVLLDTDAAVHKGRRIARQRTRHVGAAGYMLTRHAAQVLLSHHPMPIVVDNYLFNPNASPAAAQLNIYQVQPALVTQGNEPPGWTAPPTAKYRPEGMMLLRQKLKRAWYEMAYPAATWARLVTRRARLEQITYAASPPLAQAPHTHISAQLARTPK
jgi:glycosyl transferase family 25